jgi:hypothetical protein
MAVMAFSWLVVVGGLIVSHLTFPKSNCLANSAAT